MPQTLSRESILQVACSQTLVLVRKASCSLQDTCLCVFSTGVLLLCRLNSVSCGQFVVYVFTASSLSLRFATSLTCLQVVQYKLCAMALTCFCHSTNVCNCCLRHSQSLPLSIWFQCLFPINHIFSISSFPSWKFQLCFKLQILNFKTLFYLICVSCK